LLSFFMILLSRKAADACVMSKSEARKAGKHPVWQAFATDESLCHRAFRQLDFQPPDALRPRCCCMAATPGRRIESSVATQIGLRRHPVAPRRRPAASA
jgi:hypothetical protein